MGDPFNKLTEILLKTDFQNITYDNLKHILTFFISGRSHRVGISRVIGDFKKPFITEVKYFPQQFKKINTEKYEKKLEKLGMSKEKTDFIKGQFKKLLEITDDAIQYNAPNESDYKKFLKNSKKVVIYKGVNKKDEQLVNTFGIGERLVRYKNKNKIREIDKIVKSINEANRSNNYEKLIQIIENVIDTYSEHNQPMLKIILEQLGFTIHDKTAKPKPVGGGASEDDKYLVGSLRDPITITVGDTVKNYSNTAFSAISNKLNVAKKEYGEKKEKETPDTVAPNLNTLTSSEPEPSVVSIDKKIYKEIDKKFEEHITSSEDNTETEKRQDIAKSINAENTNDINEQIKKYTSYYNSSAEETEKRQDIANSIKDLTNNTETPNRQTPTPTLTGGKKKKQNQNNLLIQDRIHFILLLFIIRTIVLFIATHNGYTKTLSQTTLLYFTIYVCFIILFVILANSNIVGFTELFYYLNTNTEDGRGLLRIILQLTCICALIPIPYIVKDKKELSNVTLYIFILASIVALIV